MKNIAKNKETLPDKKDVKPRSKPVSKNKIYQKASCYAIESIEKLVYEMRYGDNSNARTGAAKTILSKCLPDLKATDLTSDGEKIEGIDVAGLLKKAYGDKPEPTPKMSSNS